MAEAIFLIFSAAFMLLIIFGYAVPIYQKHRRASEGIINHEGGMRKFVYQIHLQYDDVVRLLSVQNDLDELTCEFDIDRSIVKFSEYGSYRTYYFRVQPYDGSYILQLEQVASVGMKSHVPFKLNPFLVEKLGAKIVPFSEYGL